MADNNYSGNAVVSRGIRIQGTKAKDQQEKETKVGSERSQTTTPSPRGHA